jgi:hypothetical protein
MMKLPSTRNLPRKIGTAHVLIRFTLRIVILSFFASMGSQGFGKTFEALLVMAALYCIFAAAIRREAPFGPVLTHFDEAAAYAMVGRLAAFVS